jgi:hypothetical protein
MSLSGALQKAIAVRFSPWFMCLQLNCLFTAVTICQYVCLSVTLGPWEPSGSLHARSNVLTASYLSSAPNSAAPGRRGAIRRNTPCHPFCYYAERCCKHGLLFVFGSILVSVSWLLTQRSQVRFPALPDFPSSSGSGTGSTQPL